MKTIIVPRCDCGHTTASHYLIEEEDTETLTYCKYNGCTCMGYTEALSIKPKEE